MKEKVIKLRIEGKNSQEISDYLNINKLDVDLILLEYFYDSNPSKRRTDIARMKRVIELRHNGYNLQTAYKISKVSSKSGTNILKNAGIIFLNPKYFDLSIVNQEFISNLLNDFNSGIPVYKLVNKYGFNKDVLARIINENGGSTTTSFNINIFDKIDTEEKAYWLGFLYADGSVSTNVNNVELSLQILDTKHLFKFKTFLNSSTKIILDFKIKRCRHTVCNAHFKNQLITLGCVPRKSLILKFPNEEQLPKSLWIPFIRGYFDGDGCFSYNYTNKDKTKITVSTKILGTKEFLSKIIEILKIYDIQHSTIYKDKDWCENTYSLEFSKTNSVKLLELLYSNALIYLDRKYNKYLLYKQNKNFAVQKRDFLDNDWAISVKAKQWINNYFNIDFDKLYANTEITKEIKESLVS